MKEDHGNIVPIEQPRLTELENENRQLRERISGLENELREQTKIRRDIEARISVHSKSGLPNHYQMNKDLPLYLEKAAKADNPLLAVIIVKLDRKFDMVQKTMKSSISEWILFQTAKRLQDTLSRYDKVFHSRDDEFVVICRKLPENYSLNKLLFRIIDAVNEPHVFSGHHISIGCYLGIALFPQHGSEKSELMHNADIALENAARKNKTTEIFRPEMRNEVIAKMDLQASIIKAIETQAIKEIDRQFEIYYQPIISVNGINRDKIWIDKVDAEVLIRWHHPEKGILGPAEFIPVAEETGLILPLGNWVLYNALEQLEKWENTEYKDICLSVNISPRQFSNERIATRILEVLKRKQVSPRRLKLEITESCVMDDPIVSIEKMRELQKENINISIDDFGSGYSSLNYLRKLPVSCIKIDQSFIRNVENSRHDQVIVKAIIAMGQELDFNITCEGIENLEQLKFVYREGCRSFQGYYFGRPEPVDVFEKAHRNLLSGPVDIKQRKGA